MSFPASLADNGAWSSIKRRVRNESHLKRLLRSYVNHHYEDRTHCGLIKHTPMERTRGSGRGAVVAWPRVGAHHHAIQLPQFGRVGIIKSACSRRTSWQAQATNGLGVITPVTFPPLIAKR